jgi:dynein regulatory complex protein 1
MLNSSDREERIVARRAVSDTPPQTHAHRHTPPTVFPPPPLFSPLPHGRTAILGSFPFSPHPPVPTPHHQPNHVQRIAARLAAKRESAEGGKNGEGERLEDIGVAKRQIGESKKRLARIKSAGSEDVSLVRVQQDDRENLRRVAEESRRQELRGKLLTEAEHSARRNATVAMRWADLFSVEVPQELYEEIERQRAQCNKITASKDKLIAEIKNELKAKDDEYVKSLKKQAEDIDQLLLHMGQQFKDLQGAYLEELEEIEQAFLSQRGELISANKGEINVLFEKRHTLEQAFMELMAERAEHYQTELERHRVNDAEEYNILKIRLETDVQNLEQHLEAMRATYQLNTEKLEYNYRVLVERDHENQSTISQQRRKIARQRESLLALKSRYADSDKKFQDENVRLTEEYRRVTEQFKDLQAKYRHFELADIRKFQEVWAMNEETVAAKVKRVLNADRVLHEQQMGLTWHAPSDDVFKPPEQLALDAAKKKRAAAAAAAKAAKAAAAAKAGEEGGEGGEGGEEGGEAGGEAEVDEADAEEENPFEQRLADPAYADFLAKLTDETGFLIEAKVHRAIDAARRAAAAAAAGAAAAAASAAGGGGGEGEAAANRLMDAIAADTELQAERLKAESVLRALGVTDAPAFDSLVANLTVEGADAAAEAGAGRSIANVMVDPEEVILRLRGFVEGEQRAASGRAGKALRLLQGGAGGAPGGGAKTPGDGGVPRKTKEQLEQEFWERMANVVGPKTYRVWGALEHSLTKYHKLLGSRQNALNDAHRLQGQNVELRALLNQYLSSKINEELQVPPTQVI